MFIDPGALRHELSLQRLEPVPDPAGGIAGGWVEIARLFARIEPAGADSIFAAGRPLETATHRITIRWREAVAAGQRFEKAGRIFAILTVTDPDETGRYLVCRTSEEKA